MDNRNSSSRFGSAESAPRKTGSYRTPPSGSYKSRPGYADAAARRPAGFGAPTNTKRTRPEDRSYTRRPEPVRTAAAEKKTEPKPETEKKRSHGKVLLIAAALLAIVLAVILLGNRNANIHALPTIVRDGNAASFTPEATAENGGLSAVPETTAAPEGGYDAFAPEVTAMPEDIAAPAAEAADSSAATAP